MKHVSHMLLSLGPLLKRFQYGVAVVLTNQVMSSPDASAAMFGGNDKKTHWWEHTCARINHEVCTKCCG
jgi:hypothetical protein